jgi:hypothetical protein
VVVGQPEHARRLRAHHHSDPDHLQVREQRRVGHHHSLRRAERARGVLEEGDRGRPPPPARPPGRRPRGSRGVVARHPCERRERGDLREEGPGRGDDGPRREDDPRPRLLHDAEKAGQGLAEALGIGRRHRHRNDVRVEAGEEGDEGLEAGRVEEQDALPGSRDLGEHRAKRARPAEELAAREEHGRIVGLSLGEVSVLKGVRVFVRPPFEDVEERGLVGLHGRSPVRASDQ